jgi:hypothetical protein
LRHASPYVAPEKNNQAATPRKRARPVLSQGRTGKTGKTKRSRLDEGPDGSFPLGSDDGGPKFPGAGEGPVPMF